MAAQMITLGWGKTVLRLICMSLKLSRLSWAAHNLGCSNSSPANYCRGKFVALNWLNPLKRQITAALLFMFVVLVNRLGLL